jgi:RHS repeat-associated protein
LGNGTTTASANDAVTAPVNTFPSETFSTGAPPLVLPGGEPTDTEVRYFHADAIGSVRMITNETGAVVARYDYTPDGQEVNTSSQVPWNRVRFAGMERDLETGNGLTLQPLDYAGGRYYQSQAGRFIRPDDPGFADPFNSQPMHLFAYAYNNPLRWVDPTGHDPECPTDYCESIAVTGPKPKPANPATPWMLGWEWLTGIGPRDRSFFDGDPMTEQLKDHAHVQQVAASVCSGAIAPSGRQPYQLSGLQGIPKYIRDYSTLATAGQTGNLTATYLGSYGLTYSRSGRTVNMTVTNTSTIASGFRPPVVGYTTLWDKYVGNPMNEALSSGPMSKTTQTFNFTVRCQ